MPPLTPVQPGEQREHYAADHNAFLQTYKTVRQGFDKHTRARRSAQSADYVLALNKSGADIPRFGIGGIDGFANRDVYNFQDEVALKVITPTIADHYGRFLYFPYGCKNNRTSPAIISGVYNAEINVVREDHLYADVKDTDTSNLETALVGTARILYKEAGTGLKMATLQTPVIDHVWMPGKPDADHLADTTQTCSIFDDSGVDTGENIQAELKWMDRGEKISAGKECVYFWMPRFREWWTFLAECE